MFFGPSYKEKNREHYEILYLMFFTKLYPYNKLPQIPFAFIYFRTSRRQVVVEPI